MRIFRDLSGVPTESAGQTGVAVALGNFDGFHKGHQVVVGETGRIAREQGLTFGVFTTEPHPRSYFAPDQPNFRLTTEAERNYLMEGFGVEALFLWGFDENLAGTSAEAFITDLLVNGLGVRHVVVGYDYKFGKDRQGDADFLRQLGDKLGVGVSVISPVSVGVEGEAGQAYSSTLVREALCAGEARHAAALLGHWWGVSGIVVQGDQRGRQIGFPTANIEFEDSVVPRHGVYAVRVCRQGAPGCIAGVANIGRRPTFDNGKVLLEVHLFDFADDLYGESLRVELVAFIRPEQKFAGIEELKIQIQTDCDTALTVLGDADNARDHLSVPTLDDYLIRHPKPPVSG
ncbi:MAG: bifunctional riboflavin kinase/FAD synthetase [Candidatus Saccharimonadales bacterium]|nr:bifunctional riboflavin kinase/FAD synthetase [Candidatus Saccharimonadales bacterium]